MREPVPNLLNLNRALAARSATADMGSARHLCCGCLRGGADSGSRQRHEPLRLIPPPQQSPPCHVRRRRRRRCNTGCHTRGRTLCLHLCPAAGRRLRVHLNLRRPLRRRAEQRSPRRRCRSEVSEAALGVRLEQRTSLHAAPRVLERHEALLEPLAERARHRAQLTPARSLRSLCPVGLTEPRIGGAAAPFV